MNYTGILFGDAKGAYRLFAPLASPNRASYIYPPLCKFKSSNLYVDNVIIKVFMFPLYTGVTYIYNSLWLSLHHVSMSINIMKIVKHAVAVTAVIQNNFYQSDTYPTIFPPLEC